MATTITKRASGTASGGATKRVSGAITEGTTKRVTATADAPATARVNRDEYTSSIYDPWGGAWGASWTAHAWLVLIGNAGLGHIIRTEAPQDPASFLLESGDLLLLENGSGLLFENLEKTGVGRHQKRVAEAVL